MAGHSLGEYSALVLCWDHSIFADAISLVADRGRFMQEAVPAGEGAMAAILGLDDDVVAKVLRINRWYCFLCQFNNSPGQIVIAGQQASVEKCKRSIKRSGCKTCDLIAGQCAIAL